MVLPYINMNPPQVYTCSPSWTPLPLPTPYHPRFDAWYWKRILFYLLFGIHIRWWMFLLWLLLHDACKSNHYTVHLKFTKCCVKKSESVSLSVVSYSLWSHRLYPRAPWKCPNRNTGVGSHFLLQGIFLSQGLNPGLLHCRQIFQHLSQQGSRLYFKTQKKWIKSKKNSMCLDLNISWILCTYQIHHL